METEQITQGAALQVEDLTPIAKPHLSTASLEALGRRAKQLVVMEDGKSYHAIFLARRYRASSGEKAAEWIAKELNNLADAGLVHSVLAPPSSLPLVRVPGEVPTIVVFCYPLVPADKVEELKLSMNNAPTVEDLGEPGESLEIDLADDEFYSVIRLTVAMDMLPKVVGSTEEALDEEIKEYLKVLPAGTTVVSKTRCGISDLSIPYEVVFKNPILKGIKKVQLEHMRWCAIVDDHLEHCNLLTGVKYTRRGGQEIS